MIAFQHHLFVVFLASTLWLCSQFFAGFLRTKSRRLASCFHWCHLSLEPSCPRFLPSVVSFAALLLSVVRLSCCLSVLVLGKPSPRWSGVAGLGPRDCISPTTLVGWGAGPPLHSPQTWGVCYRPGEPTIQAPASQPTPARPRQKKYILLYIYIYIYIGYILWNSKYIIYTSIFGSNWKQNPPYIPPKHNSFSRWTSAYFPITKKTWHPKEPGDLLAVVPLKGPVGLSGLVRMGQDGYRLIIEF